MLRISSHIERLLLFNDCVIIPDFGGFVLQMHPAVYNPVEHTFCPPYKDIVFNPTLKHNDGLLSESYMQLYDLDFNEAQAAMKADIDVLKKELDANETILLGKIGEFQKENGFLLFGKGNSISIFNVASYGLISFNLPPIQVELKESAIDHEQLDADEISSADETKRFTLLPVKKILSGVAGVSAAAIAIFLLISTPVKDVNRSAYTASFIPSEMVSEGLVAKSDLMLEKEEMIVVTSNATAPVKDSPLVLPAPENQPNSSNDETPVILDNTLPALKIESVSSKTYYVIIASFVTEKKMNQYLSKAHPVEFKNRGVVKNNERIRVYANKTTDRKEAEEYVQLLRENKKYADAWLFIGR